MREEEKATSGKYDSEYFILGMTVLSGEYIYPNGNSVRINICSGLNSLVESSCIMENWNKFYSRAEDFTYFFFF